MAEVPCVAETEPTNAQYVFPVNAGFARDLAPVPWCPILARERVGRVTHPLLRPYRTGLTPNNRAAKSAASPSSGHSSFLSVHDQTAVIFRPNLDKLRNQIVGGLEAQGFDTRELEEVFETSSNDIPTASYRFATSCISMPGSMLLIEAVIIAGVLRANSVSDRCRLLRSRSGVCNQDQPMRGRRL